MSSLSDPARAKRGDRRAIQKLIDAAYADGRLSAAERALRTQRVEAAQTKGDLAMIARDITGPAQSGEARSSEPRSSEPRVVVEDLEPTSRPAPEQHTSLGSAIDKQILKSMQVGGVYRASGSPGTTMPSLNVPGFAQAARTIRIVVVVGVLAILGICGLGVAAFIPAFVEGFNSGTSSSPGDSAEVVTTAGPSGDVSAVPVSADLHSAAGWASLVSAIKEKSGSTSVYDLVVYPTYASVGLDGGETVNRRLYRDGAWQDSFNVQTPIVGSPVDLQTIDPKVIAKLPGESAQRLGVENPTGTYLIVNAIVSDPKIMVYVQSGGGASKYQAYSLDGTPRQF